LTGKISDVSGSSEEFVGNALCLDFANTVNCRPNPTRDSLASGAALARWAAAADLPLEATDVAADAALPALRALREAVYEVFASIVTGDDPSAAAMREVSATYAGALAHARWRRVGSRVVPTWSLASAEALGWRVAASAVDVLRDGPLDRVRACPTCRWLFLDTSRNGRRRWCSMATCGSRAKSAHYFAKSKSASRRSPPSGRAGPEQDPVGIPCDGQPPTRR
jgi:predicted RNA-binding Zn ribbon-like protein